MDGGDVCRAYRLFGGNGRFLHLAAGAIYTGRDTCGDGGWRCAARGFIDGVQGVAHELHVSALLLSLLIIPIATELPEKVNSILWVRRGKDTMAMGNITGAMVFQGTLLPAIGILLTPWEPRIEVLSSVLVTLGAAIWVRLNMRPRGLAVWALLLNAVLYVVYLAITLRR